MRSSQAQVRVNAANTGPTFTNPVLSTDFADPMILRASDGWYYAYATQTVTPKHTENIQAARSKDLVHWETLPDVMPVKPQWASQTQNFWAPHVVEAGGRFIMHFSAERNERTGLSLGVATSRSPAGPFVSTNAPLTTGPGFREIDSFPFDDPNSSKHYLYWGSGFGPIRVQELSANGLQFAPGSKPTEVIQPSKAPYENLVEGAWVVYRQGYYYLFYSGDNCCKDEPHYAVLTARSKSPTGPFVKLADATGKSSSAILAGGTRWLGPGHNAVVTDAKGQDWIVYHAIDAQDRFNPGTKDVRRPMLIDRLNYQGGWPVIEGGVPSDRAQALPAL
ncbi:MAG: family 43 glycosylhydrolase [Candidatus Sericytochromatia bacterium]|nr:family 43 glycosylhydrolase [Candidatus Sericytochromatia bacterium]